MQMNFKRRLINFQKNKMKNIFFLLTIFVFSCSSPKSEIKKVDDNKTDTNQEVPIESEITPVEVNSSIVKYWYISYTVHRKKDDAEWKGYKVIGINKPYFDVGDAIRILYPSYISNEDYVGIDFFQEVPKETYTEFNKEEK